MDALMTEPVGSSRGTAVLLHGFGRRPHHLDDMAARIAGVGARVVRPALSAWWWPTCTNNTRYLDRIADAVAVSSASGPVVVLGHSAGAAAGAWVAARLVEQGRDVRALVLIDGVESPVRSIARSWSRLRGVPVLAICGDPGPCNRRGALGEWLRERSAVGDPMVRFERLVGMGHGDVEGVGLGIYVRLCRDDPDAPQRERLLELVEQSVSRALDAPAN